MTDPPNGTSTLYGAIREDLASWCVGRRPLVPRVVIGMSYGFGFIGAAAVICGINSVHAGGEARAIAGWVEPVAIAGVVLEAKLDTGAQTSSLGAANLVNFSRNGERWVRFDIGREGRADRQIEAPLVRRTRVRRAGTTIERRPVVILNLCLAGYGIVTEFTLTDRSGLDYVALIGREALGRRLLVDPGRTHLTEPTCPQSGPQ